MYVRTYVCLYNEVLFGSPGDILGIGRGKNNDGKGLEIQSSVVVGCLPNMQTGLVIHPQYPIIELDGTCLYFQLLEGGNKRKFKVILSIQ